MHVPVGDYDKLEALDNSKNFSLELSVLNEGWWRERQQQQKVLILGNQDLRIIMNPSEQAQTKIKHE